MIDEEIISDQDFIKSNYTNTYKTRAKTSHKRDKIFYCSYYWGCLSNVVGIPYSLMIFYHLGRTIAIRGKQRQNRKTFILIIRLLVGFFVIWVIAELVINYYYSFLH
jgi:hypothetical protein